MERRPKLYIGGPYHYNDGDEGVTVREVGSMRDYEYARDSLPPTMLWVREVVAYCAADARSMLRGGGCPSVNDDQTGWCERPAGHRGMHS